MGRIRIAHHGLTELLATQFDVGRIFPSFEHQLAVGEDP